MIYNIWRSRRLAGKALAACVLAACGFFSADAGAADSAVILIYHRFGDTRYPATNIRLEQFDAHIAELTSGKYAVMPLPEIVAALASGKPLPDRAVAITIDDAFRSVYDEAWPRLRKAKLPFTLFVATQPVERHEPDFMSWDQIRAMRDGGATIGAHSNTHLHMADQTEKTNREEITTSNRILERELGTRPRLFAYPYGEASAAVMTLVKESGYQAAFGQQSGVADRSLQRFYLPRFPLNETYGAPDRVRVALNALPLAVEGVTPQDPLIPPDANPPAFGFTLRQSVGDARRLTCYNAGGGQMQVQHVGARRIEIRFSDAFAKGRSRVNCTLPGPEGRWQWYGMQFYVKP